MILVTGFEPFLQNKVNPSAELIQRLQETQNKRYLTQLLPVSYQRAPAMLKMQMQKQNPQFVLCLGLAVGRDLFSLERVALNWIESTEQDNDQVQRPPAPILGSSESAYYTHLPLQEWCQKLRDQNFPVQVTFSAGAYVCNALYYQMMHFLGSDRYRRGLFVHVPSYEKINKEIQWDFLQQLLKLIDSEVQ